MGGEVADLQCRPGWRGGDMRRNMQGIAPFHSGARADGGGDTPTGGFGGFVPGGLPAPGWHRWMVAAVPAATVSPARSGRGEAGHAGHQRRPLHPQPVRIGTRHRGRAKAGATWGCRDAGQPDQLSSLPEPVEGGHRCADGRFPGLRPAAVNRPIVRVALSRRSRWPAYSRFRACEIPWPATGRPAASAPGRNRYRPRRGQSSMAASSAAATASRMAFSV